MGTTTTARGEQGDDVLGDAVHDGGLLLDRTGAQGRSHQARPSGHESEQVDLGPGTCSDADDDDPAAVGERGEIRDEVRCPDELDDEVVRGGVPGLVGRDDPCAERRDGGTADAVSDRGGDLGANGRGELDRGETHAAGCAGDEDPFAGDERAL